MYGNHNVFLKVGSAEEAAVALDRAAEAYVALIERKKISPQEFTKYEREIKEIGKNYYDEVKEKYEAELDDNRGHEQSVYENEPFQENLKPMEGVVEGYDSGHMNRALRR